MHIKEILTEIRNILKSKPPASGILYQYTDFNALQGIIKNKELWATDWRYMNDENEFTYGFELLKDFVKKNGRKYKNLQSIMSKIDSVSFFQQKVGLVICSLTEDGDLLSQWRGYGRGYNSVSIGFDFDMLERFEDEISFFNPIYYKLKDQVFILQSIFSKMNEMNINGKYDDFELALQIYVVLLSFKEECWREEREWRYIQLSLDKDIVKLRPGNFGPIPYLPLKVFGANNPEDCIKEIIIPKSKYYERTKFALKNFLLKKTSEEKIKSSKISIDYGFSMASR